MLLAPAKNSIPRRGVKVIIVLVMTFFGESVLFLSCILVFSLSIRGGVSNFVPTDGPEEEGAALEVFFNATSRDSGFEQNKTCDWNRTRIVCDSLHSQVLELHLAGMNLTGSIPAGTISNLTGLLSLDLSNNQLSGTLPDVSPLVNLTDMNLSGNNFKELDSGAFPSSLVNLDLSANGLVGPFPTSLFSLGAPTSLKLGRNSLSGDIDLSTLTSMLSLQVLDLSNNNLSGAIPTSVNSNLSILNLQDNNFNGNVTQLIDFLNLKSVKLTVLELSSNKFSSQSFPSDFSQLVNLTVLGLAGNKFLGHSFPNLPILAMPKLQHLNLSSTSLSGPIPESICNISSLVFLDLADNNLSEGIPDRIGALKELEKLDLSRNNLSGGFPSDTIDLTFLSFLNVSFNNLSGPIPTGLQFETFGNTSYLGNAYLCGSPLSKNCPTSSPDVVSTHRKGKSSNVGAIVGGVLGGVVLIAIAVLALILCRRVPGSVKPLAKDETRHVSGPMQYEKDAETWATGIKDPNGITVVMFEKPLLNITFADLLQATGNFCKDMQVADGGYGPVYKGTLQDGTQLAIKVLVEVGFSDENKAVGRIEALAKVKHSNLVSLIGYCLVGEDTILIYEYMVNGDLQRWLHELPEGNRNPEDWTLDTWEQMEGVEMMSGEYLSWPTRHKIALGIARGLAFLHHGCSPHVIHRDVKTSNILLDESFEAHLVDSGLAGIARVNGTPIIGGTLGYVPPEYGQTWQATTRGDVYSFGVVLLELVTGRKPTGHYFHDSCGGNLVGWVRTMIRQDKRGQKALDPKLVSRGHVPEMLEVLRIGYLCTADTPAKRPTMQQVVGLLKDCQSSAMS